MTSTRARETLEVIACVLLLWTSALVIVSIMLIRNGDKAKPAPARLGECVCIEVEQ